MLSISKVLEFAGLDISKNIKIARHMDTRGVDVHELYATGHFELYQSYQEKNHFRDCDYLVSCLGIENNQAIFIGVYEVRAINKVNGFPDYLDVPYKGKAKTYSRYRYELKKLSGFEELENRLLIKWENRAQAWCMKFETSEKEIVQLLPKGYVRDFPGYLEINLSFRELQKVIDDPNANNIWHKMLSSVGGVYLIVDTEDGLQYVGSAAGKEGILGRWKEYANNGHGGNKKLREIIEINPERVQNFRFSILQTLPRTLTRNEALIEESKYKHKLGTRAYGLNLN
ncbi:GIY-YIG nuclease family protein [Priestia aryabhattai]|uniref:GIY-YIG nuclease family protein n=1 Tax=Priestia aryabhattai TaxID=412384 RepID=UPI002452DD8F|nr:GIY-YIG nuclease family protein [Priestia aryabhattai]MDH3111457.1 GIY-YIG nuclease family protein [Priestia aryabhattai]MDH3129622.1 GIY-YIG nuclease family protein [Priestia aryabhattai]